MVLVMEKIQYLENLYACIFCEKLKTIVYVMEGYNFSSKMNVKKGVL